MENINLTIREEYLQKNRKNLSGTPARIPLQSLRLAHFNSLPRLKRQKDVKIEMDRTESGQKIGNIDNNRRKSGGLSKSATIGLRERTKSDINFKLDPVSIGSSPENGLNKTSIKRIRSIKKSQSDILSIMQTRENSIRKLDSDFEDLISKAEETIEKQLKSHKILKNENISKILKCKICKRKFHHDFALESHRLLMHSTQSNLNESHISQKSTKSSGRSRSSKLFRRAKSECGSAVRYGCSSCSKTFSSKWKLKFHSAMHFNEKTVLIECI